MNMVIDGLNGIGWKKQRDTADQSCRCGSWKLHWIRHSKRDWPSTCSNADCHKKPTQGSHLRWLSGSRAQIVPLCDSCSKLTERFNLRDGVITVVKQQYECS